MTSTREPIIRFIVKHPWFTAATAGMTVGIGAVLLVVSGLVPIGASSGHWWITARLLDFAKVQSVRTHSIGVLAPDLAERALLVRGAAHYAIGCEPCHGGPASVPPPVMTAMTPPPPALTAGQLRRWDAAQLFSIVKHGIKFTGMPAWPAQQRDDEVWAVVAFLNRLPELDAAAYRRLAAADWAAFPPQGAEANASGELPPQPVRDLCWRCHGADGAGREAAFPRLAGQRADYLHASLRAFAERRRFSGTMGDIAARLDDGQMREIALYYERLPLRPAPQSGNRDAIARGAALATRGDPGRDIPACAECHGPTDAPKNPAYPLLQRQHAPYLALQLELLRQRRRGGSPRVNLMHAIVDRLAPTDARDLAHYYASLGANPLDRPQVAP